VEINSASKWILGHRCEALFSIRTVKQGKKPAQPEKRMERKERREESER